MPLREGAPRLCPLVRARPNVFEPMTSTASSHDAHHPRGFEPTQIPVQTVPSHDALPPGARLGEYEIERVLGEGGFGIVYLATDHGLERHVAIKEYLPAALASRGKGTMVTLRSQAHAETFALGLRSFVNEARLLARFDHPSLVRVYRFWEANHTAYMVMPYYEGRTLAATREGMAAPPDEAWLRRLLNDLCGALAELHASSCYHRDIAPDNILMLSDGRAVLLDFGAARRVIGDRTQTLTAILKPAYAPIEQYAEVGHLQQGPWTDIYALAAVVYYCITGRSPTPSTVRAVDDQLRPLSEVVAQLRERHPQLHYSEGFLRAIEWALAVRPYERPQTVADFLHALDAECPTPRTWRPAPAAAEDRSASPADRAVSPDRPVPPPLRAVGGADDAQMRARPEPPLDASRGDGPLPPRHAATPAASAPVWHFGPSDAAAQEPAEDNAAVMAAIQAALRDIPADTTAVRRDEAEATRAEPPARRRRGGAWRWAVAASVLLLAGAAVWIWRDHFQAEQVLRALARPGAPAARPSGAQGTDPPPPQTTAALPRAGVAPVPTVPPAASSAAAVPAAPPAAVAPAGGAAPGASPQAAGPAAPMSPPPGPQAPVAQSPVPQPPLPQAPVPQSVPQPNQGPGAQAAGLAPAAAPAPHGVAAPPPQSPAPQVQPGPAAQSTGPAPAAQVPPAGAAPQSSQGPSPQAQSTQAPPSVQPPVAPSREEPRLPTSPREACGGRTQFALYYCMQRQCERGVFYNHPQCQRLRATDEVG